MGKLQKTQTSALKTEKMDSTNVVTWAMKGGAGPEGSGQAHTLAEGEGVVVKRSEAETGGGMGADAGVGGRGFRGSRSPKRSCSRQMRMKRLSNF